MRLAAFVTLFLSLLLSADIAYDCSTRSLAAFRDYYKVGEGPEQTVKQNGILSRARQPVEAWQGAGFLAIGFSACAALWLLIPPVSGSQERHWCFRRTATLDSMIGSAVGAALLAVGYGVSIWGELRAAPFRLELEVWSLAGAVGGAILGGVVGLLVAGIGKMFTRQASDSSNASEPTALATGND